MPSADQSQSSSVDIPSSAGSAYPLILEHIFKYSGAYELPLRTMLTLNAQPFPQSNPLLRPVAPAASNSAADNTQVEAHQIATAHFTSSLVSHITKLPSQPCSLPPSFITTFLRKCFPFNLMMVDFPQALTGLDYLKDLENRRRREIGSTMKRLGLGSNALNEVIEELRLKYPALAVWMDRVEHNERRVETLYTLLYASLRRWILINELHLQPFNKHNCVAMLNTLYPPQITPQNQPTAKLTTDVLKNHRNTFFRYIKLVESNGPACLEKLMQHDKRPGDDNGWPAVRETLDKYLRIANSSIEEAQQITDIRYFDPNGTDEKDARKVDSGVSFYSERPSTSGSTASAALSDKNKRLPNAPASPTMPSTLNPNMKGYSTLEKIAREIRKLKSTRKQTPTASPTEERTPMEVDEALPKPKSPEPPASRGLRKVRSLGTMRRSRSRSAGPGTRQPLQEEQAFDKDEMKRQRELFESKEKTRSFEI